jgi:hypothetical protein
MTGRGNRNTRRKPDPSAALSTTNPTLHDLTRYRTRAAVVGSRLIISLNCGTARFVIFVVLNIRKLRSVSEILLVWFIYDFMINWRSRDSAVGIATSYGMVDREVGVQVPVGSRIFSYPRRPGRPWAHPISYPIGTRGPFSGGKAAGVWRRPITSNQYRVQENMDL